MFDIIHNHYGDNPKLLQKLNQLMAKFEDFQVQIDRFELSLANLAGDIKGLKEFILNLGLTVEQEDAVLLKFKELADKAEALAAETPEAPVEPPVEG